MRDRDKKLLINKKQLLFLKLIGNGFKDKFILAVAKKSGFTYAHSSKLVKDFEEIGLIKTNVDGRKRYLKMTKKGKEIIKLFDEIAKACPHFRFYNE